MHHPQNQEVEKETVKRNGKRYIKALIRRLTLYPIRAGDLVIETGQIKVSVRPAYQDLEEEIADKSSRKQMVLESSPVTVHVSSDDIHAETDGPPAEVVSKIRTTLAEAGAPASPVLADAPSCFFVLDLSGSMLAEDAPPQNRVQVMQAFLTQLLSGKQGLNVGIHIFAGQTAILAPLGEITSNSLRLIKDLKIGMIGSDGTALGSALYEAVRELDTAPAGKFIVLVADGTNNAGYVDPLTAADFAKRAGIAVYVIAVGKGGRVQFPVNDPAFGKRYVHADVNVDTETLRQIAEITGGTYAQLATAADINAVVTLLDATMRESMERSRR